MKFRAVVVKKENPAFQASQETRWEFINCRSLWAALIWLSIFNGVHENVTTVTQCVCITLCISQGIRGQKGAKGESATRGTVVTYLIEISVFITRPLNVTVIHSGNFYFSKLLYN